MKKSALITLKALICAVILALSFWFMLPPINLRSTDFWSFVCYCIVVLLIVSACSDVFIALKRALQGKKERASFKTRFKSFSAPIKVGVLCIGVIIVLGILATFIGSEIFNAKSYNGLLSMTDGDFSSDVAEISREQIPVVDRDTASRLGQRKLGEMSDLVSQFEIMQDYTQINYLDKPVRVTPLAYGDIIKWLNNRKQGIPAYITVDMTTQDTALVRLEKGMRFSESEYFMRNIHRYLRFKYPTKIFDDLSFEIDEEGTPYFVAPTITYRIGLWSGKDISGAVLVNAITGECNYYDVRSVPTWVDQVFSSDLIIQQLIYNGKYRSGFFNSIFGQKGVLQPTEGYNYLAINDDVWLYTGITSVTSDESNVGFVLCNLRTKETKYYAIPGAEEYSAMSSAEGQVQHLAYRSTFPILLNISNRPIYFMSLKDGAGLVKMYAFVDVQQYHIVGTGNTVSEAQENYFSKLAGENITTEETETTIITGVIEKIGNAVIDGNTIYYIMLDGELYSVPAKLLPELTFMSGGEEITLELGKSGNVVSAKTN